MSEELTTQGTLPELPDRIPVPADQWLEDFRRSHLPIVLWVLAAAIAGWLILSDHMGSELIGMAQPVEAEISAATNGVIVDVLVDLFEEVEPGQVVALLDSTDIEARIATARAVVEHLQLELAVAELSLDAEASRNEREWNADGREEARLRIDVLDVQVSLASDRVEEQRLALDLERQQVLHESGIVSAADLDILRLEHERLLTRIAENEKLLAQTSEALQAASSERQTLMATRPSTSDENRLKIESLRLAAQVKSLELQELELARRNLALKAPIGGQVRSLLASAGQMVLTGEPVMVVTDRRVNEVVMYLPEGQAHRLAPQTKVLVSPVSHPDQVAEAVVARLSPAIERLPPRLWRSVTAPEYGRSVLLSPVSDLQLTPGEMVTIRLANGFF